MAQIIVTIDPQGNPTIMVQGVKGTSCKDLTRDLERKLGQVTSDAPTRELTEEPIRREVERDQDN